MYCINKNLEHVEIEFARDGSEQMGIKDNIKYIIGKTVTLGIEISADCRLLHNKTLLSISKIIWDNNKQEPSIGFAITRELNYLESADNATTNNIIQMKRRVFLIIIGDIDLAFNFSNNVKHDIEKQFSELDVEISFKGNLDLSCRFMNKCIRYGIRERQLSNCDSALN